LRPGWTTGRAFVLLQRTVRVASVSHAVFALAMIGLGILGLIGRGDFSPLWQPVPEGLPTREVLAYLTAFVSLASGVGLLWNRTAAPASRLLFTWFLLWLLIFRVPAMLREFGVGSWWAASQTAVMVASTWVLYSWFANDWDRRRLGLVIGEKGVRFARVLFGLGLIPFGLAHFLYLGATAPLVPGWLPGHVFWAYFTGATFIAAGVAVLIGVHARLAAALTALQIGMFTLLVWVPIVVVGRPSAFQWNEFVVSGVLTAAAGVVADSWHALARVRKG
jgi:uncharacterized membrane protein